MKRFYVPPDRIKGDAAHLDADQTRRLARVLRLKRGDEIIVFDGEAEFIARITEIRSKQATLEIIRGIEPKLKLPFNLCLAQALIKAPRMDMVIEKATELGVRRIIPVKTARSAPRPGKERSGRLQRWRKIAMSAASQSGRPDMPSLESPMPFDDVLVKRADLKVILYEGERDIGAGHILQKWKKIGKKSALPEVMLMVGPEGGFTREEAAMAREEGWVSWGLGDAVLRAETASIVGAAILIHELVGRPG